MRLAGAVVASWSLTQEVAEWQVQALLFFSLNSANSVKTFRENANEGFSLSVALVLINFNAIRTYIQKVCIDSLSLLVYLHYNHQKWIIFYQ